MRVLTVSVTVRQLRPIVADLLRRPVRLWLLLRCLAAETAIRC